MTEDDYLLLPYCPYCGAYKGIGVCRVSGCPGATKEGLSTGLAHRNIPVKRDEGCAVCGGPVITRCSSCGLGYWEAHSVGKESRELERREQRLGTCDSCGEVVCENCWILGRQGRIICLTHLQKD